jgi:hypothetical protein
VPPYRYWHPYLSLRNGAARCYSYALVAFPQERAAAKVTSCLLELIAAPLSSWRSGPVDPWPVAHAPGLSQSRPALFARSPAALPKSPTFLLPLNQTRSPQSTHHPSTVRQRGRAKQRLSSQSHRRPKPPHHTSLRPLTSFLPPHLLSLTSPHLHLHSQAPLYRRAACLHASSASSILRTRTASGGLWIMVARS